MPLDFTSKTTKPAALAAYVAACEDTDSADWCAIAAMLAQCLEPKARASKQSASGEWCEYTQAQRSGRGGSFHASRRADFLFADGVVITVSLCHKMSMAAPDWARAARCAVSFYKAKRSHMVLRALNNRGWASGYEHQHIMAYDGPVDRQSRAMPVPEIVEAVDVTRNVLADVAQCNQVTMQDRAAA
jgi:hypothetical protein